MFERLYFHEVTFHLNVRYCACFEQEVVKLQSVDSLWNTRSSHRRCSVRKDVLRSFAKFTGKHLCQSLFFKKRLWHRCFPVNLPKFPGMPFLQNTSWGLLLSSTWHDNNIQLLLQKVQSTTDKKNVKKVFQTKKLTACLK